MAGNYSVAYRRPANMLLCLRNELNAVFPNRYTGTDGFVSGYDGPDNQRHAFSGHNPNNLGHCMAFDLSTPANGQQIDEAAGRALSDYLRTKKNEFFSYLIHDMGPVAAEPRLAGNGTNWGWALYTGAQHADHVHISLTNDYQWGQFCGLSQDIYDRTVYWGIKEWYDSYKNNKTNITLEKNPPQAVKPALIKRKTYGVNEIHWTVDPGDTLTKIAQHYGIPKRVEAIAEYNGIDPDELKVGEKIWIPAPLRWNIEAPDSLRSVAAYYGLDADYLARLNGLPNADSEIYIGNQLIIK